MTLNRCIALAGLFLFVLVSGCGGGGVEQEPADLVLINGKLVTVDDNLP